MTDSLGHYIYNFIGSTAAIFVWWLTRAGEYLRLHPNAQMPQWLRSMVSVESDRKGGYPRIAKAIWIVAVILGTSRAYASRLSPLDGALKVGLTLGWWLFGIWYLERLLSPGENPANDGQQ